MGSERPSNASIDELFERSRGARVRARDEGHVDPARGPVIAELAAGELPRLREALAIRETDESFHCMCLGDLSVELRGSVFSVGTLSFHHGRSVRLERWSSDAWLADGPALLRLLSERGVAGPLADFEAAVAAEQEGARARERWLEAAPPALRGLLPGMEGGMFGPPLLPNDPKVVEAMQRVRAAGDGDALVARDLLRWLGTVRSPWSGHPAYEQVPLTLLAALPPDVVLAVACESTDEPSLAAAARHYASHQMVSFRKSVLAAVPDRFFERVRPLLAGRCADDLARFEHAARLARETREVRSRSAPYPVGDGCTVVGQSVDGPLSGLAALDGGGLLSVDVRTVVRFEPGSTAPAVVAEASEHFVVVGGGRRAVWATMNHGDVLSRAGDGPVERLASQQKVPLEIVTAGEWIAWMCRDAPGGAQIAAVRPGEAEPRVLVTTGGAWMLCADDVHVYFVAGAFKGSGELRCVPWEGGRARTVCALPNVGASMGTPRTVTSGGEVLVATDDVILSVDPRSGRASVLAQAEARVRAIAASDALVAMLVGSDSSEGRWAVAVVARTGGKPRRVATLSRAPYHRHALVLVGDCPCTTSGDKVLAATG